MVNEKNKIEALLFASAKRMNVEEISNITGIRDHEKIKIALQELKVDIEERGNSMSLEEDSGFWRFTVKEHYMPMLNKVLTQAELDKPLMETLAVIAWKYPVLQSAVVKIRHNKAYDHLKQLEEIGFISRYRQGRTNKITLTNKFFEYFDLPTKEQAKEVFKNIVPQSVKEKVEAAEEVIDEAEKKIEEMAIKKEEMEKAKEKESGEPKPGEPKPIEPNPDAEEEKGLFDEESEDEENELREPKPEDPKPLEPNPTADQDIKKEVEENVSTEVSEVQEQDEVSEPESGSEKQE